MTRIFWSPKSLRDLEDIRDYVAKYNPAAARRLVEKIIDRMDRVEMFPESGGFVDEDEFRRYRQVIQGNYRVIYRFDPNANTATVITVIHAARLLDPSRLDDDAQS